MFKKKRLVSWPPPPVGHPLRRALDLVADCSPHLLLRARAARTTPTPPRKPPGAKGGDLDGVDKAPRSPGGDALLERPPLLGEAPTPGSVGTLCPAEGRSPNVVAEPEAGVPVVDASNSEGELIFHRSRAPPQMQRRCAPQMHAARGPFHAHASTVTANRRNVRSEHFGSGPGLFALTRGML